MANTPNPQNPTGTSLGDIAGQYAGKESSLSNWAGDYVTDMLGRGKALGDMGYTAYEGPLTAGQSGLQNQAFQGIANLAMPSQQQSTFTPQSFTDQGMSQQYMNPYVQSALNPQIEELRRQSEISKQNQNSQLAQAGAFGGSRQAVMNSELDRNLQSQIAQTLNTGYMDAFNQGQGQFNTEQGLGLQGTGQNQQYGLSVLGAQGQAGQVQRDITQQGIGADRQQFEQERDFPYQQVQYMQSLLQGLPVEAQSYNYTQPSGLSQVMAGTAGVGTAAKDFGVGDWLQDLFGPQDATPATATPATDTEGAP